MEEEVNNNLPTCTGSVTINSSDMADHPVLDTNTFGSTTDQEVTVAAFKRSRALLATEAFAPIVGPEIVPGLSVQTDEQILE